MNEAITVIHRHRYQLRGFWLDFTTAVTLFNREADLQRLVQWAVRKRLAHPRRLYEWRLQETQEAMQRIRYRTPVAFRLAYLIVLIGELLHSRPLYPKKGSAANYRQTVC